MHATRFFILPLQQKLINTLREWNHGCDLITIIRAFLFCINPAGLLLCSAGEPFVRETKSCMRADVDDIGRLSFLCLLPCLRNFFYPGVMIEKLNL